MKPGQKVKIEETNETVTVHAVDEFGRPTHYEINGQIKEVIDETLTAIFVHAIKSFGKWIIGLFKKRGANE